VKNEHPIRSGAQKPDLLVDVDGVISLFGFAQDRRPDGRFHWVNGVLHYISAGAGERLRRLEAHFQLVWATGWEETANEYLPRLLELPGELPCLRFDEYPVFGQAHWKLSAIDAYAPPQQPLAWIDDSLTEDCREWAAARPGPTLLVQTKSERGIEEGHVAELIAWSHQLQKAGR
jgi:HAD domain in Swiss Army Knife RNA repair proteins